MNFRNFYRNLLSSRISIFAGPRKSLRKGGFCPLPRLNLERLYSDLEIFSQSNNLFVIWGEIVSRQTYICIGGSEKWLRLWFLDTSYKSDPLLQRWPFDVCYIGRIKKPSNIFIELVGYCPERHTRTFAIKSRPMTASRIDRFKQPTPGARTLCEINKIRKRISCHFRDSF